MDQGTQPDQLERQGPQYDIREWSPDHEKMGKGVTLSNEEAAILKKALDSRDL